MEEPLLILLKHFLIFSMNLKNFCEMFKEKALYVNGKENLRRSKMVAKVRNQNS
jgi:hypothetical protein